MKYDWDFGKYLNPWVFLIQPVAQEEKEVDDSLETCPYCGIPFTTYDNGNGVCVKCGHTNDNSFDEEGILYEAFPNKSFRPKLAYFTENLFTDKIDFPEKLAFFAKVECVQEELLYWEDCMKSFHPDYYIESAAPGQRIKKFELMEKFLGLGFISESGGLIGSHAAIEHEKEF